MSGTTSLISEGVQLQKVLPVTSPTQVRFTASNVDSVFIIAVCVRFTELSAPLLVVHTTRLSCLCEQCILMLIFSNVFGNLSTLLWERF